MFCLRGGEGEGGNDMYKCKYEVLKLHVCLRCQFCFLKMRLKESFLLFFLLAENYEV